MMTLKGEDKLEVLPVDYISAERVESVRTGDRRLNPEILALEAERRVFESEAKT